MAVDRTSGNKSLEETRTSDKQRVAAVEWSKQSAAVALAAASPAHGCCDETSSEEYERWDGMS